MECDNAVTFAVFIGTASEKLFPGLYTHALSRAFYSVGLRRNPQAESDSPFHELALQFTADFSLELDA